MTIELKLDEPWALLNARGNPVAGRRLTFVHGDGTVLIVDVTNAEYGDSDVIKTKLAREVDAHDAIKALAL